MKFKFTPCNHLTTEKFSFNEIKHRGQVMILYALLIPVLIIALGVGLDLGWYYLNVSRLQNAADAAAVAGAHALIDSDSTKFADYNVKLVAQYPADLPDKTTDISTSNEAAVLYAMKNVSNDDAKATVDGEGYIMNSNYSRGGDKTIKVTPKLYKDGDDYYYVVSMSEKIHHFFIGFSSLLGGETDDMSAPVVAVALISKNTSSVDPFKQALDDAKNQNVIVGNWEDQDFYKSMEPAYKRDENGNYVDANGNLVTKDKDKVVVYATDRNGNYILDENGNKMQDYTNVYANSTAYTERFDANIYAGAWNQFQDFFNHFWATGYHDPSTPDDSMLIAGDFYRVETITIRDDVNAASDRPYGANSSVAATSASINKKPGHVNNPEHKSTKKTYAKYKDKDGTMKDITDTGNVGLPYKWEYLDSINVDFKPEVTLPDKWIGKDWDVSLEDNSGVSFNYKNWATPSGSRLITNEYIKHMRIHANINFDEPYKERSDLEPPRDPYKEELREKDAAGNLLPDILWGRIESEPMLFYPDALNGYETHMGKKQTYLSSVRQIIINVNSSNHNTGSVNYRPVIIFYDGPERYSLDDPLRDSKPVILNLGKPFRGVLYAPNSPVVVIGNAKDQFKGFVVAKKYMRLKDDDDFEFGGYRYFNSKDKQYEYTRHEENGKVVFRDVDNPSKISGMVTSDAQAYKVAYYYAKDDTKAEKTKYYRTVENKTIIDNGVETPTGNELVLYTDEYGEVQFEDLPNPTEPWKCGEYDNFGRTDFTTENYKVAKESANNMLLSGK